jgi:chromosome segregation ATPase
VDASGQAGEEQSMSDIEQLQQRITAAMDRVAYGLTQLGGGDAAEMQALRTALDEEKTVTAQLTERVATLRQKQESEKAETAAAMEDIRSKIGAMDLELQKLRQANDKLREANQALREANRNGVGDAHLINASVLAELEALRTAREVERAEADTILSALAPALSAKEEAADA